MSPIFLSHEERKQFRDEVHKLFYKDRRRTEKKPSHDEHAKRNETDRKQDRR